MGPIGSRELLFGEFAHWEILLLTFAFQSLLLGVFLYSRNTDLRFSHRPFTILFFILGISFLLNFSYLHKWMEVQQYFFVTTVVLAFSLALALYYCLIMVHRSEKKRPEGENSIFKYETSRLTDQFAEELKFQLKKIMDLEKPFLDPDLNLDDLAGMLNISRHLTSQLINEYFGNNFHDFINRYRICEAKALILGENDLNVYEVALKSGFNNRISFYRAFKKCEGLAPTEFKAKILV